MNGQAYKDALASWASGVSVVAARADSLCYGLTVSSFTSVSFDPPLVLVCITNENRLPDLISQAGGFSVSLLSKGQDAVSANFARKGREPMAALDDGGSFTPGGRPVITGALAWVDCTLHALIVQGDHTLAIGRVVDTFTDPTAAPLVYFRRAYRAID